MALLSWVALIRKAVKAEFKHSDQARVVNGALDRGPALSGNAVLGGPERLADVAKRDHLLGSSHCDRCEASRIAMVTDSRASSVLRTRCPGGAARGTRGTHSERARHLAVAERCGRPDLTSSDAKQTNRSY